MIRDSSVGRRAAWFHVAAIASCVSAAVVAQEGVPQVALSDVARQVAAARTAAESDGASVEDRVRFATWALMVAELAIEPYGLVSTASDLFEEGQDAIEEVRAELAADPESERALVMKSPLLAARLDAAVVRQERVAKRRALAREEERERLNDLRAIAKAFRAGLAAQSESQAWAALGDATRAEKTLTEAWRALDGIDATVRESRDYFLMEDEPDLEANPDATLITEVPTAFRSPAIASNAKALAALRLLSTLGQAGEDLYRNPDAAAILEKSSAWASAALAEDANPPGAPEGFSPDNVFALYARGRAKALAAALRAWGAPVDKSVAKEVAQAIKEAVDDYKAALDRLKDQEDTTIHARLTEGLQELESPQHVTARIASLIDAGMMDRAVTDARSLAMRRPEPDLIALYLDTARRGGVPIAELQEWCRQYVAGGEGIEPTASPALRNAVGRLAVDAAASRMTSVAWPQATAQERDEVARAVLAARETASTPAGTGEGDAAALAATRALLTAYAWLASPGLPVGKALLAAAVEDARNADLFLSQSLQGAQKRNHDMGVLDTRESLVHCRLARGFLAIAVLPDYRDEARLAFAAALDEAGRLPVGGRDHGMLGSPLLTSLLRGDGEGQAAKLVAEERSTRQAMTRFVEACFAMEFGAPTQATEQFRIARDMAERGSGVEKAADAAEMMRVADGFDVAITLPESMAAFETLGLVAAGRQDEALRSAVMLARSQAGRTDRGAAGETIDFNAVAGDVAALHSPLVAYALAQALGARLDAVALGRDPARADVLQVLRTCHARCVALLDTARQRDRYPHLVQLVATQGRELDDPAAFVPAVNAAAIERGLRRHPAAAALWNAYFELIDEQSPGLGSGREAAEQALATLDAVADDPLVPASALALTRAVLLERLDRVPLARQAYSQAKTSGASAEDRVVAASRDAVLMLRTSLPAAPGTTDPRAR